MKHYLGLILVFLSQTALAQALQIEAIGLQHRPAVEIEKVIKPLLSDQGTVQTYNNDLIIQDTPEQMKRIKSLISHLDTKATRLLVSISQGPDKPSESFQVQENGRVEYGVENNLSTTMKTRHHQTSRESKRTIHHVSLNSGETAYLQTGKSIPIVMYEDGLTGDYAQQLTQTENEVKLKTGLTANLPANANTTIQSPNQPNPFATTNLILSVPPVTNALINVPAGGGNIGLSLEHENELENKQTNLDTLAQQRGYARHTLQKNLKSGVYIQPTLLKDQVSLYVQTIDERPHREANHQAAREKPSYSTQSMETTLVVPIGEWVYLGGNQKETEGQDSWNYSSRDRELERSHIWVRVDTAE